MRIEEEQQRAEAPEPTPPGPSEVTPTAPAAPQQFEQPAPVAPPVVQPTYVQPPPVVQQPAAPQAQPPVATPPVVPPAQPEPVVQPQAPSGPPPLSPAQALQAIPGELDKVKDQYIDQLAKFYQLPEKEMDELNSDPGAAIPKLMGKLHFEIVRGMMATIGQQLPVVVNSLLELSQRQRSHEDEFWKAWPQLNKQTHRDVVMQIAGVYAQTNPQADTAVRIKDIGALTLARLGMLHARQPVAPPNPQVPPAPRAFSPAGNGTGLPSMPQQPDNEWARFASMFDQDVD